LVVIIGSYQICNLDPSLKTQQKAAAAAAAAALTMLMAAVDDAKLRWRRHQSAAPLAPSHTSRHSSWRSTA
jgi:hypothetical protein